MILSKKLVDKTILLIDSDAKKMNDRTWCFWDDIFILMRKVHKN
jgi:lycopene beta-cyclase